MSRAPLGYCTNVHAGPDLARCLGNLERFAVEVKRRHSPHAPMGIGLWLANEGGREVYQQHRAEELRVWLADHGLVPFTFNGFPYGDFHQPVVKHAVYRPEWWTSERTNYTMTLAAILNHILPGRMPGSISTLPIAWPPATPEQLDRAGAELASLARFLQAFEGETGRLIHVGIEPEPGCVLDHAADVVDFFERHVLPWGDEHAIRRHLRVCHDVCHAAVMFEDQAAVLDSYRRAGLLVGKVQVSSAVGVDLSKSEDPDAALAQLAAFDEPRYLHQTMVRHADGSLAFHEDLPLALAGPRGVEYRVHFHVPIHLERFGHLDAMQGQIRDCLAALGPGECDHFEVETYAWGVLPTELRVPDLATGIAREMDWLATAMPPE
ncbi:MAG: metabolite traffic protein EboE [Gemmataceae bacterium]|nr:metabolite traffic protein EboE [Gemmataceae bacterium]